MAFTANNYSLQKALQRFSAALPNKTLGILGLFFAFAGFLDATYLTVLHYKHIIPPCSVTHGGCEVVLSSQFATIWNIPLALIGAVYYTVILVTLFLFLQLRKRQLVQFALATTTVGLFISLVLILLQAFVIHAFCQFCLGSEIATFLLFDALWWLWRKLFKEN